MWAFWVALDVLTLNTKDPCTFQKDKSRVQDPPLWTLFLKTTLSLSLPPSLSLSLSLSVTESHTPSLTYLLSLPLSLSLSLSKSAGDCAQHIQTRAIHWHLLSTQKDALPVMPAVTKKTINKTVTVLVSTEKTETACAFVCQSPAAAWERRRIACTPGCRDASGRASAGQVKRARALVSEIASHLTGLHLHQGARRQLPLQRSAAHAEAASPPAPQMTPWRHTVCHTGTCCRLG